MGVLVTLRVSADPKAIEATDPEVLNTVIERAGAGQPTVEFWHHLDVEDDVG